MENTTFNLQGRQVIATSVDRCDPPRENKPYRCLLMNYFPLSLGVLHVDRSLYPNEPQNVRQDAVGNFVFIVYSVRDI